jgi:uncharacterized protein YbbK (DUF523 family)
MSQIFCRQCNEKREIKPTDEIFACCPKCNRFYPVTNTNSHLKKEVTMTDETNEEVKKEKKKDIVARFIAEGKTDAEILEQVSVSKVYLKKLRG